MDDSIDPECALASAYVPAARRTAFAALWRLDAVLARTAARSREPMLAAIKLAWWRDALIALDVATPTAEPLLRATAAALLPAGISGRSLSVLAEDWTGEAVAHDDEARVVHAADRGARLFRLAATILGGAGDVDVEAAGEGWGLVDFARRSGDGRAASALATARDRLAIALRRRWPRRLRPIGMLAVLARNDARRSSGRLPRKGSPSRVLRMAAHRLVGS